MQVRADRRHQAPLAVPLHARPLPAQRSGKDTARPDVVPLDGSYLGALYWTCLPRIAREAGALMKGPPT